MKKIWMFLILFALVSSTSFAQFSITGKVRSFAPAKLQLTNLDGKVIFNQEIKNGEVFTSPVTNIVPDYYKLKIANSDFLIFLENKPFNIKGFIDQKNAANSVLQFEGAPYFDVQEKAEQQFKSVIKNKWETVKSNYNPIVLAALIYKNLSYFMVDGEALNLVYTTLHNDLPNSLITKYILSRKSIIENFAVGSSLTPFSLPDKNGKLYTSNDYRGKLIVVDFWASWCAPCRVEMKSLTKIYEEFKSSGDVAFISISIDEDKQKWLAALAEDAMPWTSLWEDKALTPMPLGELYGFQQIPFIMLIDKEGKIVARNIRGESVREEILKHK